MVRPVTTEQQYSACTDYYYFVISSVWLTAFCQFSIKKMMMMMMIIQGFN